jgi:hypothetical protein
MDLRDKGIITADQYHEAVNRLLFANYHFVSINADGLLWVLRNADFKASTEVVRIIRSLHGPVCSEESAIHALSDLVRRLWLEPLLDHQKLLLLDLVLNTLTTGRDPTRTLRRFKIALRERFALIPHVALPIYQSIDLWVQQKTLYEGSVRSE